MHAIASSITLEWSTLQHQQNGEEEIVFWLQFLLALLAIVTDLSSALLPANS